MRLISFIILAFLATEACDDSIEFEQPQPANQSNLNTIPKKLRGTYKSTDDSSYLIIDKQNIIDHYQVSFRSHMDSLDFELDSAELVKQSDSSLLYREDNAFLSMNIFGDSVYGFISLTDTSFTLSESNIPRRYKGYYFLNFKRSASNWKVRMLSKERKQLKVSRFTIGDKLDELQEITDITEIKTDSGKVTGYKLNPSKKELKKLLKFSFKEEEIYEKVYIDLDLSIPK